MYTITIGIPAYNAHQTIRRTLASIMNLDNISSIKVIIVDDASDTNYDNIVNEFSMSLDIDLIRLSENAGPGNARNLILDNCKTEFVVFIDADDEFIVSNFLTVATQELIKQPLAPFYMSNFYTESKLGEKTPTFALDWLHGKVYRLSAINNKNIRFPNTSFMEDFEFNLELFLSYNADPIYSDIITYIYHTNPNSILSSFATYTELWLRSIRVGIDIRNRVMSKPTLLPEKITEYIREDMVRHYSFIEFINDKYYNNTDIMESFLYRQLKRYYKKIIQHYPVNLNNIQNNRYLDFQTFYQHIINAEEKKSL